VAIVAGQRPDSLRGGCRFRRNPRGNEDEGNRAAEVRARGVPLFGLPHTLGDSAQKLTPARCAVNFACVNLISVDSGGLRWVPRLIKSCSANAK
jgi:hypothetical protein